MSTFPCAISSPVTDLAPALIAGLGPTSSYWPPCSASGFQSVCSTIVAGQPAAFRLSAAGTLPDAAAVLPVAAALDAGAVLGALVLLLLLAQAVAVSARAVPSVAARAIPQVCCGGFSKVSLHYG